MTSRYNFRLSSYLSSWGTTVPKDIDKYRTGREMQNFCVFCTRHHSSIGVIRFDAYQTHKYAQMTDAHMCDQCAVDVIRMESLCTGESLRTSLFDSKDLTFKTDRIEMFVQSLRFDGTVHSHYVGRDSDIYIHDQECYFCKSALLPGQGMKLQVPMDFDGDQVVGGRIPICTSCAKLAKLRRVDEDGNAKISDALSSLHTDKLRIEECPQCHSRYTITLAEYSYRQGYVSHNRHLCPDCTFIQLHKSERDALVLPMSAEMIMPRHVYVECGYCNEPIGIDTTIPKKLLHKKYVTKELKRVCYKCRSFGDFPIFSLLTDDGRIRAYKIGENKFRVVKTTRQTDRFLLDYIYSGSAFMLYYDTAKEAQLQTKLAL